MDTRHFTRGCVHMGCVAILAVYINYANYICAILVLLAYSHKYRARINNRLYGIMIGAHLATRYSTGITGS